MYYRIIRNDIRRNKTITLISVVFVAAASMLVSLAAILAVNLAGALDTFMNKAKTPHFMQMHSGELNTARLEAFAEQQELVEQFQVVEFLNIDGARIQLGGQTLADSIQDNGLTVQNEAFDYLLDLDGNVINNVSIGELYVPLSYRQFVQVGDRAIIEGTEFIVAGYLRDSMMNASLSASKRFLVHEQDFAALRNLGGKEYLIEFRLHDLSSLSQFETAYVSAGLEANGPTVTYPLFRMMNALSDGLMIGVVLLVSMLIVAVALMSIRFTLLAKIEDDYREIGVMKAIGLRISEIRKIYLAKYAVIAALGSFFGYALSLACEDILLENIRTYMGDSEQSEIARVLGIVGIMIVFLAVMIYVSRVLRAFRNISAAAAIRYGASRGQGTGGRRFTLSNNKWLRTNIFLGVQDVLTRKKLYVTMLAVFIICSFIMIVPQNLYSTVSAKGFINYMGIGNYDMRIDIQQTADVSSAADEILKTLSNDPDIQRISVLTTKNYNVKMDDGSQARIKLELGDPSIFPIEYSMGRAPSAKDEIALSSINADDLGKKVGDTVTLIVDGEERSLIVSGIYSDITNGGKTAKAVFTDHSAEPMWTIICVELSEPSASMIDAKVSQYANMFPYAKASSIEEYVTQTFGSTIRSIQAATYAAVAVALFIAILITLLFMKLLMAKDRYSIAVMKALGYTNADITVQYITRAAFVLVIGIISGSLLANTLGEWLAGTVITTLGATRFAFTVDPLAAYLLIPVMLSGVVLIAAIIGTSRAGDIKISEHIKE